MPSTVTLAVAFVFVPGRFGGVLRVLTMTHPSGRRRRLHCVPSMIGVTGVGGGGRWPGSVMAVAGMHVMRIRRCRTPGVRGGVLRVIAVPLHGRSHARVRHHRNEVMASTVTLAVAFVFAPGGFGGVLRVLVMTHSSGRRRRLHSMPGMLGVTGVGGGGGRPGYMMAVAGMHVMGIRRCRAPGIRVGVLRVIAMLAVVLFRHFGPRFGPAPRR